MEKTLRYRPSIVTTPYAGYTWIEKYSMKSSLFKGQNYHFVKRVMDILLVVLAAPLWMPLMAAVAVLIKLESPGAPSFFHQFRTGFGGKQFKMYKFRTMVPNAEEMKKELMHLNELQWPDFKITNDPRITRIGNILRKTSLDELPQLINVLKGDMSLVGPRPTSFSAETYKLWHTARLDVKPGITGLWQIVGRAETEFDDRLKMDLAYIRHRCMVVDFSILFKTVLSVLEQKGAY